MYKPGLDNKAADVLSRIPEDGDFSALISSPMWLEGQDLTQEIHKDSHLQNIVSDLQKDPNSRPGFVYKDGVLLYKDRLVIPANSRKIPHILS